MEQKGELTEHESLRIIQQMINTAKQEQKDDGRGWIIWAAKDANFVCIEPWCGIADNVIASGNLEDKEGIQSLEPKEHFERTYSIEVF